jgi:hypothetical protein
MWAIIDQSDANRHVVIALDADDTRKPTPPDHSPPYLVEVVQPGVMVGMVRGAPHYSISNFGFESTVAAIIGYVAIASARKSDVKKKKQARKPAAKKPLLQKQAAPKPVVRKKAGGKRGK